MSATRIRTQHARGGMLYRLGGSDILPPPPSAARFPGDPGVGNMRLGASLGTYSATWFDQRIYGATPTARHSTCRIYNGNELVMDPVKKTLLVNEINAGRVPMFSFKQGTVGGATGASYTCAQIAAGDANAKLDLLFADIASLPGPIWPTFYHEPEDNHLPLGTKNSSGVELSSPGNYPADYRAAFRYIVARSVTAGLTNVAWTGPHLQGFQFLGNAAWGTKASKQWRQYHPNWNGTAWAYNVLKLEAYDVYNPGVFGTNNPMTTAARNRSWAGASGSAARAATVAEASAGMPQNPWIIGEHGLRGEAWMDDSGITMKQIIKDMIVTGAGSQALVGCAFWNEDSSTWDSGNDATGLKVNALKDALALGTGVRALAP